MTVAMARHILKSLLSSIIYKYCDNGFAHSAFNGNWMAKMMKCAMWIAARPGREKEKILPAMARRSWRATSNEET